MSTGATRAPIPFSKMNGLGNEIVVVDLRGTSRVLSGEEARAIATSPSSHFDQMMVLHDPRTPGTEALVRIYNRDGSDAGACGNGMRCVGWLAGGKDGRRHMRFETRAGVLSVDVESVGRISVDMGRPRFAWQEIPLSERFHDTRRIELQIGPIDAPVLHSPSVVNVGNPHAIFWVADTAAYDLGRLGPLLENHPIFPEGANISLAEIRSRSSIRLRTWERGAGLTKACGSAACAAAVCGARTGRVERQVVVELPGGVLEIEWRADDHIIMTGPAQHEHDGVVDVAALAESSRRDGAKLMTERA